MSRHRRRRIRVRNGELADSTAQLIRRKDWDLFVTLTTKDPVGPEIWLKRYRTLVGIVEREPSGLDLGPRPLWKKAERLRHVVAFEPQRRGAIHAHALWAAPDLSKVRRRWIAQTLNRLCTPRAVLVGEQAHGQEWLVTPDREPRGIRRFEIMGMAQVVPVASQEAVTGYCSKYVAKGGVVEVTGL